jgi:hypothetical protein
MSQRIKTTISANNNIFDVNGQWLPKGNYYFCIDEFTESTAKGELFERSFNADYEFHLKDLVKMMSIAQARLARRANIINTHMPSSASPTLSPVSTPNELSFRRIREYVSEGKMQEVEEEPITCTICLENISETDNNTLVCNHSFHDICINRWLATNTNCPICRRFIRNRLPQLPEINNRLRDPIPMSNEIDNRRHRNNPLYHIRRRMNRSNIRVAPIITRNIPIVRPRSPIRVEHNRPVSSSRRREYNRIYSSGNSILR